MLMQMVESIERDLQSTIQIKNRLNNVCDVSWGLICPPGKGNAGKFIAEKSKNSSDRKNDHEACSSTNDLYSNVTDLINYAQLVRSNEEVPNNRGSVRTGKDGKTPIKGKNIEKIPVKNKRSSSKTGRSASLDFKTSKSSLSNASRDNFVKGGGDGTISGRNEITTSCSALVSYSHSCSSKITEQMFSLKFSEDLNHLFRLFNSYVDLNSKVSNKANTSNKVIEQIFCKRFKKNVKSKLETALRSTNHYEKYMKYVQFSEEAAKNKNFQEPPLRVHYRSKEQLELFETTSHKLLELQLQSKLLNIIDCYLSEAHDEV